MQPEDLLKFGLIPELVGRLPVIATMEELLLKKILVQDTKREPRNALTKQYQKLFEFENIQLRFTEGALTGNSTQSSCRENQEPVAFRSVLEAGDARRDV